MPEVSIPLIGRYLALTGEHVLLLAIGIGVGTSIKSRHGVIQYAIELDRKNALPVIMFDALSEFESGAPSSLII